MSHSHRNQKEPQTRLKAVEIGDGNMTVDLPSHFVVESEEKSVTFAYDPRTTAARIRFSGLYLSGPQGSETHGLGVKFVRERAKDRHQRVTMYKDRVYSTDLQSSQEDGESWDVHFWVVGIKNCVVLMSCRVARACKDEPAVQAVLNSVEQAIRSLRESKFQKYKLDEPLKQDKQPLLPEHTELLDQLRQSAIDSARTVLGKASFTGGDSDLKVIQALLDHPNFDKSQGAVIEGLGIIFGGILARKLGFQWVSVTDKYGSTPALHHIEANISLFPKDMIIKRIDRGEAVNVMYLFHSLCEEVPKMIATNKSA